MPVVAGPAGHAGDVVLVTVAYAPGDEVWGLRTECRVRVRLGAVHDTVGGVTVYRYDRRSVQVVRPAGRVRNESAESQLHEVPA